MTLASLAPVLAVNAAVVFGLMALAWLWSLLRKDAGLADVFWGLSFVAVAVASAVTGDASGPRRLVLVAIVGAWGLRLSIHLAWRNLFAQVHPGSELGEREDRRYRAMRRRHGARFRWVSAWTVFGRKALLVFVVSLPVQLSLATPGRTDLYWADWIGIGLFALGMGIEVLADWQLGTFKLTPGSYDQVLSSGLWRYSRHPNYFGDAVTWWGIFMVAAAAGPQVLPMALGPALLTALLVKAALGDEDLDTRRPGYDRYRARTSPFVPLPPRPEPATPRTGDVTARDRELSRARAS
ncbi:MAG: DUF1295 domain-containing protein [Deltaproteobacteria bacterium]|nr:MAG: DUF1295 domain-containing protein [Deltaproteobacteria bacterium]